MPVFCFLEAGSSVWKSKMAETIYHVIDQNEKRVIWDHYSSLDAFVASLSGNPESIENFNATFKELTGKPFFDDETKFYDGNPPGPNYMIFNPSERTNYDIPQITPELIEECEQSPHRDEFPTVNDYRRHPKINGYPIDGIVVADLRKKELRYLSDSEIFTIPRERPTDLDREFGLCRVPYLLPESWKLIQE